MIKKPLLLLILLALNISYTQNTIGTIQISSDVYEGYTLFTISNKTYLINNCGEVINQWSSTFPPGNSVYLLENGNILRAGRTDSTDITFGGQGGVIEIFDWQGNLEWQYFYDTPNMRQHHDVFPMPNGNVLILAVTKMNYSEAIQAGRNPNLLVESELYNEQIIEVTPVGLSNANIVWEWNIKDHLIQDFDSSKNNYGNVGLTPEKLDVNFLNSGAGSANWLHINSIQYNSDLDQIVLSARNLSEIYVIDHSTTTAEASTNIGGTYGKGGDFLYRWGNPQSYRQGTETDRKLFGQHDPHFIQSGLIDEFKIMVFNNGFDRAPQFSEVFIIDPDTDSPGFYSYQSNTQFSPNEVYYTYTDPVNQSDFFSGIVSSSQRLPNGNILICEGLNGRIFEINQAEETVWEYIVPVNTNTGAIYSQGDLPSTFSNLIFRAKKYDLNYPAFLNKDLTPGNPIELNPNLTECYNLSVESINTYEIGISPNPTYGTISISGRENIENIKIYSIDGKEVSSFNDTTKINLSHFKDGIYFLKIKDGAHTVTKKIIKI